MVRDIFVNVGETKVTINKDEVTIHIKNLTLDLSVKASSDSTDHFLDIVGTGNYTAKELDGEVTIKIKKNTKSNRLPLIELMNATFNVTRNKLKGNFSGNNDLFLLANATSNLISSFIVGVLDFSIFNKTEVQVMLDFVINSIPTYAKIENYGVEFDFSTMGDPAIVNGMLPIKVNGLLNCYDKSKCKPYDYKPKRPEAYNISDVNNDLQVVITDYLLQEISILAYQKSLLMENSVPKFNTDVEFISDLIPAMKKYYKGSDPVIIATEFNEPPMIQFTLNQVRLNGSCKVNAYVNSTNKIEQALSININLNTHAELMVMKGNLTGKVRHAELDIKYIAGKLGEQDISDFRSFLYLARKLLIPQLNDRLKEGILIQSSPFYDFGDSSMKLDEKRIIIGVNPKLKKVLYVDESFDWIAGKFSDSYNTLQDQKSELLRQQMMSESWIKTEL